MKPQIKLAIVLAIASILIFALEGNSQRIALDKQGNYVQLKDTAEARPTGKTFTTTDGIKYPVWKSAKGKYFVIRVSKKTGNKYRQYLKLN